MPSKNTNRFRANLVRSKAVPDWRVRKATPSPPPSKRAEEANRPWKPFYLLHAEQEAARAAALKADARKYWEDILGPL